MTIQSNHCYAVTPYAWGELVTTWGCAVHYAMHNTMELLSLTVHPQHFGVWFAVL